MFADDRPIRRRSHHALCVIFSCSGIDLSIETWRLLWLVGSNGKRMTKSPNFILDENKVFFTDYRDVYKQAWNSPSFSFGCVCENGSNSWLVLCRWARQVRKQQILSAVNINKRGRCNCVSAQRPADRTCSVQTPWLLSRLVVEEQRPERWRLALWSARRRPACASVWLWIIILNCG